MKQIVSAITYGMFLDIFTIIGVCLTPIWIAYLLIKRLRKEKNTKEQKCVVCKNKRRRIDEDGICQQCNDTLDDLYDTMNGDESEEDGVQDGAVPWMSVEVVPAGMPEKKFVDIDIRIDSNTGMLYTVKNGIYREIGSDM